MSEGNRNDEDINWELNFSDYQEQASQTAIYPREAKIVYPALGLSGEVGELCNKIKKMIRDGLSEDDVREFVIKESGDVLWYWAMLLQDLGIDAGYVANKNLDKLFDRAERGVLGGSGDNR